MKAIDTLHLGQERAICCWQHGEVLIDPGPTSSLQNVIDALDGWVPSAILLTHIHFDHATAAGTLARMYPELKVYVHERGYPHMLDPTKLWASASRIYGADNMLTLWGEFEPVPQERLVSLAGGETLQVADETYEVAYTPGHAQHHVCYLTADGTVFAGDVAGMRDRPEGPVIPPVPPPDIDPPLWLQSIETVRAWNPQRIGITHFGLVENPDEVLDECAERLQNWSQAARDGDRDAWAAAAEEELRAAIGAELFPRYHGTIPVDVYYAGLRRYWDKLDAR